MKRKSVFNQEIRRVPHFVTYLSVPLPPFKTGCMMCVLKERHQKNDRGKKRENEEERMRQKERRGEKGKMKEN